MFKYMTNLLKEKVLQPSQSNPSVKYSGPWSEASGYAQANRNIIQALNDAGVDVVTELQVYANHKTDYGLQLELARSLQNKHSDYKVKVLHITPNVYKKHKEEGKYHIGHLFWETTKMSPYWAECLQEVDEIWTGCKENEETFRNSGFTKPIFVFPQPIDVEDEKSTKPIDGASGYIFYSIFQWIERKNPKALLQAYWREFSHGEDVTLVIKSYGLGFNQRQDELIQQQIKKWKAELQREGITNFPKVLWINKLLSKKEMGQLHNAGDCFVTAHRFEGWGIPIVEALTQGKPVISTNLGGVHQWIPDDCMYKVGYQMCDVFNMDWAEQYTVEENKWAEVDQQDLRAKMRFVFENKDEAEMTGQRGQAYVRENLNFNKVGKLMRDRLEEILKTL